MNQNTDVTQDIDVRKLIPIERHKLLLQMFKDLPAQKSFIFTNDHDPIPLFYEFRSVYGDVVGWEYLNKGGHDWKVKVTRTQDSVAQDMSGVSTMMDLRTAEKSRWMQIVFHRFGMMEPNTTMKIISKEDPVEIHNHLVMKLEGKHKWVYEKKGPDEYIIHLTKIVPTGGGDEAFSVVSELDFRPYPPAERHEMFYKAFAETKPGEAFEFFNDHDPKPLYYQMEAESKDPFRWEYLEQGPEQWKVRVIKLKEK